MQKIYQDVADMMIERGAIKFGSFKLKLHETNPDAPLSPYFIHLRTKDNPGKPGPLTEADCDLIVRALWQVALANNLSFQAMAGIPYAGDPLIRAMERMLPGDMRPRIIRLAKEVEAHRRRIVPAPGFDYKSGEQVLVLDDLVTKADSKIEAIQAIESSGSVVNDLVVLVDREQGGQAQLKQAGYNLYSCFTVTDLFEYYSATGRISQEKLNECLEYMKNN